MPIYEKPTKALMYDFAKEKLRKGQIFSRDEAIQWFKQNYPNIKSNTVGLHVNGMAINSELRKHHPNIKPNSGHDLFYKIGNGQYRLWEKETDPLPIYMDDLLKKDEESDNPYEDNDEIKDDEPHQTGSGEFAYERDLKNYLAKNLHLLEKGLRLYEEDGFSGVEFPAGGRFIDILALDKDDNFVIIELKVSRGYDRVIGQILRYMSWIERNLSEGKSVRGIIVASNISEDLILATSRIQDVKLFEYEISLQLKAI